MSVASESELMDRITLYTGRSIQKPPVVVSDTTNYMIIQPGMVLQLGDNHYYIKSEATEGRFGLDDQPKMWVKYAIDLAQGNKKVVKLPFYEDYSARIGPFLIKAFRSPEKESDVLAAVHDHPYFMHGETIVDEKGNKVRVIDQLKGVSLYHYLLNLEMDHEAYFFEVMPQVMARLLEAVDAIGFMIKNGLQHGDIRSDHIIVESETGLFKWIDFDYQVSHSDFDLWSLGNVISSVVGKGSLNYHDVLRFKGRYPGLTKGVEIGADDCLMVNTYQIANMAKLFPYVPEKLNRILINFSVGTEFFYEEFDVMYDHLREAYEELLKTKR